MLSEWSFLARASKAHSNSTLSCRSLSGSLSRKASSAISRQVRVGFLLSGTIAPCRETFEKNDSSAQSDMNAPTRARAPCEQHQLWCEDFHPFPR